MVDSLAEVIRAHAAAGMVNVGGELLGGDVLAAPMQLVSTGGTITSPLTIRLPREGFAWSGGRADVGNIVTPGVVSFFGGGGTISDLEILGGAALGQLTVGLDQNRKATGDNVPRNLTVDGFDISGNPGVVKGMTWTAEKLHAIYINTTTTGGNQNIVLRNGACGPVPGGGPVVKVGGDGGCKGVTLDTVAIRVGGDRAADGQLPRSMLFANALGVLVRNVSIDAPSIIDIQAGAQVTFEGGWQTWPAGTKVLAKVSSMVRFGSWSWAWRTQVKWLSPGQSAPGITWR